MKKVIVTIFISKLSIFLVIFLAHSLLPFSYAGYYFNFHFPINASVTLQTAFSTWDGQHYLFLAQKGYHIGEESNRFFPLLPSMIKLLSPILGFLISGLFITNFMSAIGLIFFYLLVKEFTKKEEISYLSLILLLSFPTSFFLSLIYSEGVFLGIITPLFYFLYKKKILYTCLCSFLLPLTRPTGILIIIPLIYLLLNDLWKNRFNLKIPLSFLALVSSIFGLILYFLIMQKVTGNFMTGIASQKNVAGHWQISNILNLKIFLVNIFPQKVFIHGFTNSIIDRVFFLFFLSMLPLIWRKTSLPFFVYSLTFGLIPLFGSFMSYTRYMLLVFPIFIALGIIFSQKGKKQFLFPYIYLNLLIQTLFLVMHSLNYWVA